MASPTAALAHMSLAKDARDAGFERPLPRHPKTPAQLALLLVQNRRREYLQRSLSYLDSLEHELADPVLYERLVKSFQTPAERDVDGKAKGYARTLEADLVRGETRLSNISRGGGDDDAQSMSQPPAGPALESNASWEEPAESKEHGLALWLAFLQERFVQGRDEDFDYATVDGSDEYDAVARREAEDAWFDQEEPSWVADEDSPGAKAAGREGETGIQDF